MRRTILLFGILLSFLSVNAQVEDSIPPVFNWITITPYTVSNNDTITIQISGSDDVSGLKKIGAYLGSPNQPFFQNMNGSFHSIGNNVFEAKVKISEWAISGNWFISSISMIDSANNTSTSTHIEYFTVNSTTPDSASPDFVSINVFPDTVLNGDTVTIQLTVSDDVSGVNSVGAYLANPTNVFFNNLNSSFQYLGNNVYEKKVKINEWAQSGEWYVWSMNATDNAQNSTALDSAVYFTVLSSTPDALAPVIHSITLSADTVYNNDTIAIQIVTSDAVSGVASVGAYLGSPENTFFLNLNSSFEKIAENTYESKIKVNNWAVSGQWFFSYINALDSANNSNSLDTIVYFTVINSSILSSNPITSPVFSAYPNPTTDVVTIELGDLFSEKSTAIFILDQQGKLVKQYSTFTNQLDFSAFKPGQYIILLRNGEHSFTKRIIRH